MSTEARPSQPTAASAPPSTYPARMRFSGRLIAVEGIDGSGKSTQIRLLHQWLQASGYPVHLTAWNSSPVLHSSLRRGKRDMSLTPTTFSLLHAADLADRLERELLPRLRAGQIILCDRWVCTSFARDGARGLDPDWLRALYAFAPRPRLTVYFRVPTDMAVQRIMAGRPSLKYYEAGMDLGLAPEPETSFRLFQQRVLDRYEALVGPEGLTVIDALDPVAVQQLRLRALVERALRGYRRAGGALGQIAAAAPVDPPARD